MDIHGVIFHINGEGAGGESDGIGEKCLGDAGIEPGMYLYDGRSNGHIDVQNPVSNVEVGFYAMEEEIEQVYNKPKPSKRIENLFGSWFIHTA